uniref:Uncharacterized protein n=1 Tax=Scophthalmus maximus TaxID=52904 RepID=A0A8D3A9J7_SCOMX
MCTTMVVLTTIALILRQRFSNKIRPAFLCGVCMFFPRFSSSHSRKTCRLGLG